MFKLGSKSLLLVALLMWDFALLGQSSSYSRRNAYVWSFNTRHDQKTQMTQDLTTEFEEFLVQSEIFNILNRRYYADLLEQWDIEISIRELSDLPDSSKYYLKVLEAEIVFFGEFYSEPSTDLGRIIIIIQDFSGNILFKGSEDGLLSKLNSSIKYRESRLKTLVNQISREIMRNRKKVFGAMKHRVYYKRGFGINLFPVAYPSIEPGVGISFQSDKRWEINFGLFRERFDGMYFWIGGKYDMVPVSPLTEDWSFLAGLNIGLGNPINWFGTTDFKLRYKFFACSMGVGYNNLYKEILIPIGFGIHIPIDL